MSQMKLNIFIHRNTTGLNITMKKITGSININIPALMQPTPMNHEHCFLHVAYDCPDNRQSSCTSFTASAILYIQVTQILKLQVETTSTYEGHTSHPSFLQLLHPTSRLLRDTSRLPKILHQLHLTLLMTFGLWGAPYE